MPVPTTDYEAPIGVSDVAGSQSEILEKVSVRVVIDRGSVTGNRVRTREAASRGLMRQVGPGNPLTGSILFTSRATWRDIRR